MYLQTRLASGPTVSQHGAGFVLIPVSGKPLAADEVVKPEATVQCYQRSSFVAKLVKSIGRFGYYVGNELWILRITTKWWQQIAAGVSRMALTLGSAPKRELRTVRRTSSPSVTGVSTDRMSVVRILGPQNVKTNPMAHAMGYILPPLRG